MRLSKRLEMVVWFAGRRGRPGEEEAREAWADGAGKAEEDRAGSRTDGTGKVEEGCAGALTSGNVKEDEDRPRVRAGQAAYLEGGSPVAPDRRGFQSRRPGELYRIADVGTDHGYVPIALAERDAAVRAIAMDVRPGPLERAREHIREHGLEERIQTRLSDGVENLKAGEADTVVIAGMGGELVIHILEGGRHLWQSVERWVLSPQSELDKVRRYLEANGFAIADEEMVEEDGKYYTVMEAVRRQGAQNKREEEKAVSKAVAKTLLGQEELACARHLYGPKLIEKKSPVLMEFLQKEERALTGILAGLEGQDSPRSLERQKELRQKLSLIKLAEKEMG